MAVFELNPCDMISAPKNTFKYTVFSIDFGVYLSISLKFSPINNYSIVFLQTRKNHHLKI